MKTRSILLAFAVLLVAWAPIAMAQATRTWVSGVGDDVNPCSRTAPCKTFAGAISKTAIGGEINALDPAGYGAVTITKSITIDGGGGQVASVLVSGTNGIIINGAGAKVILRNLRINGLGTGLSGISLLNASELIVENVTIDRFTTSGINVSVSAAASVVAQNTVIRSCATGVSLQTSAGVVQAHLDNVSISCTTGVSAMAGSKVVLHNSVVTGVPLVPGAVTTGVNVLGGATASIEGSQIRFNTTGVQADGATTVVRLSNASILDNTTGISTTLNPQIISFNNNRLTGNTTDGTAPTTTYYQR